jgi:hypothetical protein
MNAENPVAIEVEEVVVSSTPRPVATQQRLIVHVRALPPELGDLL